MFEMMSGVLGMGCGFILIIILFIAVFCVLPIICIGTIDPTILSGG
jgi:hypothetical protein